MIYFYPPKILFGIKEEEVNINLSYNFSNYLTVINQGLFNLFFFRFDKENTEKYIEPISFFDVETKKYSLQNSPENLVRFNKFIHIYVELYKHYFAVFFDWVIEEFEPEIKDVLQK
ncbi:hypothetical protein ACFSJW_02110 [Flavobacterium artemisiae]|uniref:Uncharacterized protein n=1 Tax=Flavobacterium artemisiae TaxID=2126556 RepID=A0ABW4HJL8_9FLAO